MNLNKAFIIGNLTRDPEVRALPSGANVASFGLATNRVFKKADGTKQESTEFHNIVVFGKQAEHCGQYLSKGNGVIVDGRLQQRRWETEDGQKRSKHEVVAQTVTFLPKRQEAVGEPGSPDVPSDEDEVQS